MTVRAQIARGPETARQGGPGEGHTVTSSGGEQGALSERQVGSMASSTAVSVGGGGLQGVTSEPLSPVRPSGPSMPGPALGAQKPGD